MWHSARSVIYLHGFKESRDNGANSSEIVGGMAESEKEDKLIVRCQRG